MQVQIKLKEVLQQRGLTQKELAQKIGVREASISQLIHAKTSVNKELLAKIANELAITDIRELLDFEEIKTT